MRVLLCVLLLSCLGSGQRYADRSPIPADTLPVVDEYDYDSTDGYDFKEETDMYRWNINEYPQPMDNPRYCNRMKPSNVCDPDAVLDKEQADSLDSLIKMLYENTPCICDSCEKGDGGIVIGVALLMNVFQPYNEHPSKNIRKFSESLREKWKLGKCDNDILIVVAVRDRLSYTDVGQKTSSYVSLQEAHRIFLENKSHFSANHFYEGLRAMLEGYHKSTRNMKRPVEDPLNVSLISGAIIGAVVLLGIIIFIVFIIYRKCRTSDAEKREPDNLETAESVSSSWTKQDIKVMFSSLKATPNMPLASAKYQLCETDERDASVHSSRDDDDIIDVTLAIPEDNNETQLTTVSAADESPGDALEKELDAAARDIAKTFPQRRSYNGHMTDI